jgi:hypothetical protein
MKKLGFGKYKDTPMDEVPEDYLEWIIQSSRDRIVELETELKRRAMSEDEKASWAERIVKEGFRILAKRYHPDTGGSATEFQALTAASLKLKEHVRLLSDPFRKDA